MYIGASLFLMAAGAILAWAVKVDWKSFDLNLAGLIIFGVGVLALLISAFTARSRRKRLREAEQMRLQATRYPSGPTGPGTSGGPTGPGTSGGPPGPGTPGSPTSP